MTAEEVCILKAMPLRERIKKYLPLRQSGKLTQAQYGWILVVGSEVRTETNKPNVQHENDSKRDGGNALGGALGQKFGGLHQAGGGTSEESASTHQHAHLGSSQKAKLRSLLKDGQWHTTEEIAQKVYGSKHAGLSRVGARIWDLKQDGCQIESSQTPVKTIWKYKMAPMT